MTLGKQNPIHTQAPKASGESLPALIPTGGAGHEFPHFCKDRLASQLRFLRNRQIYLGTSSWKYEGWKGLIYSEERYLHQDRFAKKRFEQHCLSEFSEVFPTVCVDAGYYRFPNTAQLERMALQVPPDFRFSFKVTDEITIRRFPKLPRFGSRAGLKNPNFLNANLFQEAFLEPLQSLRHLVGLLIFEFSHFSREDFARGREFVEMLHEFLGQLPRDWQYGVEVRNASLLQPEYFASLQENNVTHILNAWNKMPTVSEQRALMGTAKTDFFGARFLLRQGRSFSQAVDQFAPYNKIRDPDPASRSAMVELLRETPPKPSFIYVNNRLEGSSPLTIQTVMEMLGNATESF